jgi:glycosyltransferase involved in cell wall biosynthesis
MQTRISVVIPAYNSEKELASVLQSLAQSTYSAFECIVVDDCSTDNSIRVALE